MIRITEIKQITSDQYVATLAGGGTLDTFVSVIADYSLYAGRELTDDEFAEVERASAFADAKFRALRIIARRAMSRRELINKLIEKGVEEQNANDCAEWLTSRSLLNDSEYSGMIVRYYVSKGCGRARIKSELFRRGIPKELWMTLCLRSPIRKR
jgi:regulatory protein